MLTLRSTLALLISFACFAALGAQEPLMRALPLPVRRICSERCNLAFRCDPYYSGPPVWTVVDGVCKLYKTDCLFATANCQRQNDCKPKMLSTTQHECQAHCADSCDNVPRSPVCASFPYVTVHGDRNDAMITFLSQCELDKWACWNAKAYLYSNEGACV